MSNDMKIPDESHPIAIRPGDERVLIEVGGRTVADSSKVLVLREASYPPVHYVPLDDVDRALLRRSSTTSHCPYKGDASYYSIVLPDGGEVTDAVWTYEHPYPAVAEIAGYVAFYPDRVEITSESAERPLD